MKPSTQPNSFHIPGTPEIDEDHIIISPFIVDDNVIGTMNLYRDHNIFRGRPHTS